MDQTVPIQSDQFQTRVPARLDRLPWGRFHGLVVVALGVTWILDGLEVTLVGALSGAIASPDGLGLSATEIGLAASLYLLGAVVGALLFGHLTDRFGRKRLFLVTVGLYLVATLATGFAWDFWSFAFFRMLTGAGIGGEYGAVNSAIQELIPARWRGRTDLTINGSYWVGAALGALGSVVVLDPDILPAWMGWRLAFVIGGALGLLILAVRRYLPESPRWLMTHGRPEEAERIVAQIEASVASHHTLSDPATLPSITLTRRTRTPIREILHVLLVRYRRRTLFGLVLMATQAFCYNAIFFTYALILTRFYGIAAGDVGWYLLPFALGNFAGPLLLGPLFDSIGRRAMIALTYGVAGLLMMAAGVAFQQGLLGSAAQTAAWTVIFFFASAGASAAYLTVGECFPLEARALTIALFYAIGTAIGGVAGPAVFGMLIESGSRASIMGGYLLGGGLMVVAALVTLRLAVAAERRPLEEVAAPLSCPD